jgi:hypothetical protein
MNCVRDPGEKQCSFATGRSIFAQPLRNAWQGLNVFTDCLYNGVLTQVIPAVTFRVKKSSTIIY